MSLAWASIAIILLLLPGIFFFIGLASYDRLSREIIRSSVVSEVAMATVIAIAIHFTLICLLSSAGFRLSKFVTPLAQYAKTEPNIFVQQVSQRLVPVTLYLAAATAIGFGLGLLIAEGVISGPLRWLARHRWIYDIVDADRNRVIITAYVMTNIVEESKIIMYKGRLHDIFLGSEGNISYIILKNCTRYYMTFQEGQLVTSKQLELFGSRQGSRPAGVWDRLLIEGVNIANILFDSSREIKGQTEGIMALNAALERMRHEGLRGSPMPPDASRPQSN